MTGSENNEFVLKIRNMISKRLFITINRSLHAYIDDGTETGKRQILLQTTIR
jgi:hypothetical protein